jgi:hypothetical protein
MKFSTLIVVAVLSLYPYIPIAFLIGCKEVPKVEIKDEPVLMHIEAFPNVIENLDNAPNLNPNASISELVEDCEPELPAA